MSTKIIKINRGDSFAFNVTISKKNSFENHLLAANEVVYFALLYPHQHFEDAFLIKGYTAEDQKADTCELEIKIEPNDTRNLTPGVYYYTIKLQRGGTADTVNDFDEPEEIRTIVERTKFIVNE